VFFMWLALAAAVIGIVDIFADLSWQIEIAAFAILSVLFVLFVRPRLQMSPAPRALPPILIGGQSEAAFKRAARLGDGWVGSGHTPDQVLGVMTRLNALRREAGRESAPFDAILVLTAPPTLDDLRRFEDAGVTSLVSWPLLFTVGPQASMDDKRRHLETYANDVIAQLR